ncbi:hypothetical protein RND81_09G055200 [Saponaria officinalis]|uniref:Uncharacterized protein n=1 Tax=Saponaria officinalis TaxID=3572 RepID=A0AAW1IIP3_SAPOF
MTTRDDVIGERWGPFSPPFGKAEQRVGDNIGSAAAASVKSRTLAVPQPTQKPSDLGSTNPKNRVSRSLKADISAKTNISRPYNAVSKNSLNKVDASIQVPNPLKSSIIWRSPLNEAPKIKHSLVSRHDSPLDKTSQKNTTSTIPMPTSNSQSKKQLLKAASLPSSKDQQHQTTSLHPNHRKRTFDIISRNEEAAPKIEESQISPQQAPFRVENGAQDKSDTPNPFKPRRRTLMPNKPDDVNFVAKDEVLNVGPFTMENGAENKSNTSQPFKPRCCTSIPRKPDDVNFVEKEDFLNFAQEGPFTLENGAQNQSNTSQPFQPRCRTSMPSRPDDVNFVEKDEILNVGQDEPFTAKNGAQNNFNISPPFKPRRRTLIPNWPDDIKFEEKEEVLTVDGEGNYKNISDAIQPHDVWHAKGVKYFEEANNREPTALEVFKHTHLKKDGKYVKDTCAEDFVDDVDAYVQTKIFTNPSKTKVIREQIENEAFNKLMYGGETPKRPVGYGYGVKQSDVFGVRNMLKKEDFNCGGSKNLATQNMEKIVANLAEKYEGLMKTNEELMKQNEKLEATCNESNDLVKKMTTQFGHNLDVLSSGKAPSGFLDIAKSVLDTTNSQLKPGRGGDLYNNPMSRFFRLATNYLSRCSFRLAFVYVLSRTVKGG